MCLIFFSLKQHPTYKLIVAANRDEFYNRKTAAAHFWEDHPAILGGRDLEAGGTWMAMNRSGRISLLTNYRDPQNINPHAPSRGQLVSDYLLTNNDAKTYLESIDKNGKVYNGFNLIVGDSESLWYYSNYRKGITEIKPGFYGLSNHLLETPWPKVIRGKEKLKPIFAQKQIDPEQVFDILYDGERAADEKLPDTGLTLERERALSSMFIKTENYGSRCTTVVLVDYNNHVLFSERVYDLQTFQFTTQTFQFTTEP
ncbi:MAG TPA: NRDE family protein [Ohtaekwangia sp.]